MNCFWRKKHSCTCDLDCTCNLAGMSRLIFFGFLLCGWISSAAQDALDIQLAYDTLRTAETDEERREAHEELKQHWRDALDAGNWLDARADLLTDLAIVDGGIKDDRIRVITWNVEWSNRTQGYGGFVLWPDDEALHGYEWVELEHSEQSDVRDVTKRFRAEDWSGAIYYEVLVTFDRKQPVYTLLGWDGADGVVTRKIVEGLTVQGGRVRLGDRRFPTKSGLDGASRYVLEYRDDAMVSLRFEPGEDRIVFDHLSPTKPNLNGQTAFYGPDLTYDALVWKKNQWLLQSQVTVTDPTLNGPYRAPLPTARSPRRQNTP
jgi:hypothetical protein